MRANERGKGWRGAEVQRVERLNVTTSTNDNSHDKQRQQEGANLAPPGGGAVEGGELPRI